MQVRNKIFTRVIVIVNVIVIIGMLITGFADYLNPCTWGWLALGGYGFPLLVICNIFMILIWLCVRKKYVILPIGAMAVCYVPLMKFCPINPLTLNPQPSSLTILSYNTWSFGDGNQTDTTLTTDEKRDSIISYIVNQHPDVVCLQESPLYDCVKDEFQKKDSCYRYFDSLNKPTGGLLLVASRYPIISKEMIQYPSSGNLSGAFTIDANGRRIIVINNHLETNGFSKEEKDEFRNLVNDMVKADVDVSAYKSESHFLLSKLTAAAKIRAPQAEAVASYVRLHRDTPIILCGDFNDIPISYARRTISKGLTDCYISCANGPGFSYHKNAMRVRIDNIFCSSAFKPVQCKVDNSISLSDHYPIVAKIVYN